MYGLGGFTASLGPNPICFNPNKGRLSLRCLGALAKLVGLKLWSSAGSFGLILKIERFGVQSVSRPGPSPKNPGLLKVKACPGQGNSGSLGRVEALNGPRAFSLGADILWAAQSFGNSVRGIRGFQLASSFARFRF